MRCGSCLGLKGFRLHFLPRRMTGVFQDPPEPVWLYWSRWHESLSRSKGRVLKGHSDLTEVCRLGHNSHFLEYMLKDTFLCNFVLKIKYTLSHWLLVEETYYKMMSQDPSSLKKTMLKPSKGGTHILIRCLNHLKCLLLKQSSSTSTLRSLWMMEPLILSPRMSPSILRRRPTSAACIQNLIILVMIHTSLS